ncbi:MAG: hypothetical protein GX369_04595 [Euryarchaeota archaeon]|nr:hypothetical protein [Euryarchaeota archaeon]
MEFLVMMKLSDEGIGETAEENRNILERLVIPSMERLKEMESEGIVRGGFFGGQRSAAFIFTVSSGEELDEILTGLPLSAIFGIESIPVESISEAIERDRKVLEDLSNIQ